MPLPPSVDVIIQKYKQYQNRIAIGVFLGLVLFVSADAAYTFVNLSHKNKQVFSPQLLAPTTPTPTTEPLEVTQKKFLDEARANFVFYEGVDRVYYDNIDQMKLYVEKYPDDLRGKSILAMGYFAHVFPAYDTRTKNQFLVPGKKYLDEALAVDPNNVDVLTAQFEYYDVIRQLSKGQATYDKIAAIAPDDIHTIIISGRLANWKQQYDKAIEISDDILSKNPPKFEKYLGLAIKEFAYYKMGGHVDEHDQVFSQMVELTHGSWDYENYSYFLLHTKKDYAKARDMMKNSLAIRDIIGDRIRLQEIDTKYGAQLYNAGEYNKAFEVFEEAVNAYPADCGCGYLDTITDYYAKYAIKTGDQSYRKRANEIFDLNFHPKI